MTSSPETIPCTVAILTHNSGATLARALASVAAFGDILVCDGNSVDATLSMATQAGARIIAQDSRYLDESGRILDFGGIRNQTLAEARHEWFFYLDADEYLSSELVEEIRKVAQSAPPAAYWVPRKYVLHGQVIDCASTYPNQQMRFFHRGAVGQFIKPIHERVNPKPESTIARLSSYMLVPLQETVKEMKEKMLHYIGMEEARMRSYSVGHSLRIALHESAVGIKFFLRIIYIRLFCSGTRMPMQYERARLWYQTMLVRALIKTHV